MHMHLLWLPALVLLLPTLCLSSFYGRVTSAPLTSPSLGAIGINMKFPLAWLASGLAGAAFFAPPVTAQGRGGTFFTPPARTAGTFFNAPSANGFQQAPGGAGFRGRVGGIPRHRHLVRTAAGSLPFLYSPRYRYPHLNPPPHQPP